MYKKIKFIGLFIYFAWLTSCASIYTLTEDPKLHSNQCTSSCTVIPRVYGGTVMNFCGVFFGDGDQGSAIMFYDFFLSLPVDTIALPYTTYNQMAHGNFLEYEKCESNNNNTNKAPNARAGEPRPNSQSSALSVH